MASSRHDGRPAYGRPVPRDPDGFGRSIRQFALESHRVLGRPDSRQDELIGLHRRATRLLRDVPGPRPGELDRWIHSARRVIEARMHHAPAGDGHAAAT